MAGASCWGRRSPTSSTTRSNTRPPCGADTPPAPTGRPSRRSGQAARCGSRSADRGPGIPEAERGRVLDRFVRLEIARARARASALASASRPQSRGCTAVRLRLEDNQPGPAGGPRPAVVRRDQGRSRSSFRGAPVEPGMFAQRSGSRRAPDERPVLIATRRIFRLRPRKRNGRLGHRHRDGMPVPDQPDTLIDRLTKAPPCLRQGPRSRAAGRLSRARGATSRDDAPLLPLLESGLFRDLCFSIADHSPFLWRLSPTIRPACGALAAIARGDSRRDRAIAGHALSRISSRHDLARRDRRDLPAEPQRPCAARGARRYRRRLGASVAVTRAL